MKLNWLINQLSVSTLNPRRNCCLMPILSRKARITLLIVFPLWVMFLVFRPFGASKSSATIPVIKNTTSVAAFAQSQAPAACIPKTSKEAFATMLTSNNPTDDLNNNYFISARLVISKLVHHPSVRTTRDVISTSR
jgi:hypothetical protein